MTSDVFLDALLDAIHPYVPWLVAAVIAAVALLAPLPGRGPGVLRRRDPWRLFKYGARRAVMDRAGGRCEAALFVVWGRCSALATEADHIYPWSKGGATTLSNGQALCRGHNRRKADRTPPWWYVRGLERRRRSYVVGEAGRVSAKLPAEERIRDG